MIGLIQRVSKASVTIDEVCTAKIRTGMLVLVGVERADNDLCAPRLADKLLSYRLFPDLQGRMNLDVRSAGGEVLLVPQFTLAADTRSGRRPGFSNAAPPSEASRLFDLLVKSVREQLGQVETGVFGADMKVALVNDGPVTFWLQVEPDQ